MSLEKNIQFLRKQQKVTQEQLAERNTRISKKNPKPDPFSILTVHTNEGYTHWTLLYDGKYYDPEFGLIEGEYTFGKITSFLGING